MDPVSLGISAGSCCCCLGMVLVVVLGVIALLGRGGEDDGDPRSELIRMVQDYVPRAGSIEDELSASDLALTNRIGKLLMFGDPAEAVTLIDEHLADARGTARASLLNQRGGALWMLERYEEARQAYRDELEVVPGNVTALGNLVEAEAKLGDDTSFLAALQAWRDAGGQPDDLERYEALVEQIRSAATP